MKEKLTSLTAVLYTPMLIYFVFFILISLVAIASATPVARIQYSGNFVFRQIVFFAIGSLVAFVVMLFEIKWVRLLRWCVYLVFFILLVVINRVGEIYPCNSTPGMLVPCINGANRWFNLPGFQIQPSEFMRIALILVVADVIQKHNEKFLHEDRTFKTDLWLIIKSLMVIGPPLYLIYQQPDTGITMLVLVTVAFMLITAGIKWTYILFAGAGAIFIAFTFINLLINDPEILENLGILHEHHFPRLHGWLDPFGTISSYGRHLALGLTAMGSGGIFGNGFQSATLFFPEAHTDYIFAIIGMDFGMIGSTAVILVSLLFNFAVLNTAVLNRDHYNSHVCVGIAASLMAQQFWNISMILGILPITGVTLPFISHGGSSVLASMIMLGLVLSSHVEGLTIKRHTTVYREDILYLEEKDVAV
ncbi:MAG: FtsW/RodA/SpoVE family cell cycle protein [Defluviitaleaceae bacterium]|nr:FtsW/RodA/SpoVE family cell cycle protein [Defluviitaleaceae bacterium]